ncbi:MAG: carboxypeptidase regulatory-like domain-containing protein, partial [Pirellulaceae bacterium]|nr:carboxypeptidase regulatory-like domain-containing protein [Pirellulaceae bacterium]
MIRMLRPIAIMFAAVLAFGSLSAQVGSGTLKGKILDMDAGEPLPFASVVLFLNGNQVSGTNTDFDGEYTIKPIQPGSYDVLVSFVGYQSQKITGVKITANKIQFVNSSLSAGVLMQEAEVVEYTVPLIDKDGGESGGTVTREDIDKMPGRSAASIATTVAGVGTAGTGGGISIRGARPSSTWVYIDGIKVRGSSSLPKSAIEEVSVVTGGIPANIGDATGGVISISLRNSSSTWFGGGEVISSGLPTEESAIGFDKFGYNVAEGALSGPILFSKDSEGNKTRPLLGLFLSGNYTYQKDTRPTFGGNFRMTDEARDGLIANPLRQNISSTGEVNGALFNADFLTADDFVRIPTRLNAANQNASLVAKIDVNTNETTSLTFGATGYYSNGASYSYANSLMNWENNVDVTRYDWRAYAKFAQRFVEQEGEASTSSLKNVFYQVMADYSQSYQRVQDLNHQDNFFRYGHVGKFDVYKRNSYGYNPATGRFVHNGWEDTLVTFAPSTHNAELAAINNQYFSLFDQEAYSQQDDGPYESLLAVQNGNALLNGQSPAGTYGLWSYAGTQGNSFSTSNNTQFRISAAGSGDIGDHALQLGASIQEGHPRGDDFGRPITGNIS